MIRLSLRGVRWRVAGSALFCRTDHRHLRSQQALDFIGRFLLATGDQVWMEDPGYSRALQALRTTGARIVPVPVDGDGLIVKAGRKLAPKAKLAYVTPYAPDLCGTHRRSQDCCGQTPQWRARCVHAGAGIRTLGWLKTWKSDHEAAQQAQKFDLEVTPLSMFTTKYEQPPALMLGLASCNPAELRRGVSVLATALRSR